MLTFCTGFSPEIYSYFGISCNNSVTFLSEKASKIKVIKSFINKDEINNLDRQWKYLAK